MPTIADLLRFEEKWGQNPARHNAKLEACYSELGVPPARYFQLLGRTIDTREALEMNPMLTTRLLRQRSARNDRQSCRTLRSA